MGIEYSFLADWLNKFHTAAPAIQALWLVTITAIAVALFWFLTATAIAFAPRRPKMPGGQMLFSVSRMDNGQISIHRHVPDLKELEHEAMLRLAELRAARGIGPEVTTTRAEPA